MFHPLLACGVDADGPEAIIERCTPDCDKFARRIRPFARRTRMTPSSVYSCRGGIFDEMGEWPVDEPGLAHGTKSITYMLAEEEEHRTAKYRLKRNVSGL
jgi:hypothetical protein